MLAQVLALALALAPGWAAAQQPTRFVMATHQPDSNFQGAWMRRIYTEAFRRLDVPVDIQMIPLQRLTEMLLRGEIDGDVGRLQSHGQTYPELLRVEAPVYDIELGLFAIDPKIDLKRIEDLAERPYRAVYVRGVAVCERMLRPYIAPGNLTALTIDHQGMQMMAMGRADLYCAASHSLADLSSRERFRGLPPARLLVSFGATYIYPYLNRRHLALAPRLAEVLRDMRSEGVIEQLRLESLTVVRP